MKIAIQSQARRIIVPDIGDNLALPEGDRFAVHMYRPAKHVLYFRTSVMPENQSDAARWGLGHIERLENAPTLQIDGTERTMTAADIFAFDEFGDLAAEVLRVANEFHTAGDDSKNS